MEYMQHSDRVQMQEQSQQLMAGPLKHIRAAALAAALVPLASVLAAPASAQTTSCASGGTICGTVFTDTNGDGIQDTGEPGIPDVEVVISDGTTIFTNSEGLYSYSPPYDATGMVMYGVAVQIPTGDQVSQPGADNVGTSNGAGYSVATGVLPSGLAYSFGFVPSAAANPGTGTPGYWKNHPNAWPVNTITVGGITYTKAQAIAWLGKVGKDKTTTMFSSLVPAMLNLLIGNDGSCVNAAIAAGNAWMQIPPAGYGPVGSNVAASSYAWSVGEPTHQTLDAYNNGLLCAPHRK